MLTPENSRLIFVSGWGGKDGASSKDAEESCWKFFSLIYGVPLEHKAEYRPQLLYIANKSANPLDVHPQNVEELQKMLVEMPTDGDGITRVIIAHSHGARIACDSLSPKKLKSFLQKNRVRHVDKRMTQIRQHLAVFTVGGIEEIPPNYARVSRNFVLPGDRIAKYGKLLFQGDRQISKNVRSMAEKLLHTVVCGGSNLARLASTGSSVPGPQSAQSSHGSAGSDSSSQLKHYVDDYLNDAGTTNKILEKLGLRISRTDGRT